MKRFESLRPLAFGSALMLALALAGCPPAATKPTPDDGQKPDGAKSGSGGANQADPSKPVRAEDLVSGKSLRLFDDANKAFADQKQLRVYDWALLEKKYQAVVEADDRFAEAYFNLGVVYEHLRRPDDAKRAYRAALSRKPSLRQAAENLAVMAENEGKPAEAAEQYREILGKYPEDGAARARLASLKRESGDHEGAMKFAREALMREPQNLTAYKVMMRTYLERNNLNMAKLVALRATRLQHDPELFYTMGQIALRENDEQAAMGQFRAALKERDEYLSARIALAAIAVKHRDWLNASEQYKKIVQYEPKNSAARVDLGLSLRGLGQPDKAMAELDAALKADPKGAADALYHLGVIFQKNKDAPEKGLEYYKKFLEAKGGAVEGDHPVYEHIKQCEQIIRQMQEIKAEEEKAKLQAEQNKKIEEQRKKEEGEKAKADEAAKKQAEKEQRQKEAKEAVDGALKQGDGGGQAKPADSQGNQPKAEPKPDPKPEPKAEPKAEPKPEPKPAAKGGDLAEPTD
ncbi:MAG TPA: adventurous gliding motility TPR repeat lipoprotein GltE [Myxococcales bacterium]|jgi:tetratricopeptide (TPR) repeat protein